LELVLGQMHKLMMNLPEEVIVQVKDAKEEGESGPIRLALTTLKEFLDRPENSVAKIQHSPSSKQSRDEAHQFVVANVLFAFGFKSFGPLPAAVFQMHSVSSCMGRPLKMMQT